MKIGRPDVFPFHGSFCHCYKQHNQSNAHAIEQPSNSSFKHGQIDSGRMNEYIDLTGFHINQEPLALWQHNQKHKQHNANQWCIQCTLGNAKPNVKKDIGRDRHGHQPPQYQYNTSDGVWTVFSSKSFKTDVTENKKNPQDNYGGKISVILHLCDDWACRSRIIRAQGGTQRIQQ